MTIKVLPKSGPHIRLWLPMGALKLRFVYRILDKKSQGSFDFKTLGHTMPKIIQGLKKYIRRNGHFNLVEVKSHDGDYVLIRL